MNNEFTITLGEKMHRIFLQDGLYSDLPPTTKQHKHNFDEMHLIANGSAQLIVENKMYHIESGNILIIPKGVFHSFASVEPNVFHTAFQIECDMDEFSICNIGSDIILKFSEEVEYGKTPGNYLKISAYISLFLSYFFNEQELSAKSVDDYGFLIQEFFSAYYSENLHLSDLADFLHLSERQAERLVIEHTGNTFRNELASIRINIAKNLLKSSSMTLLEISQYVGYKSYAGFWKAMKKYNIKPET